MSKRIGLVSLGTLLWCLVFLLALSLPVSLVWAQATPQPGGGVFSIPTSTPAGISAPSGGLVIPTATPGGGAVSSTEVLPRLSDAQLQSLGIQDTDVQSPIQAGQVTIFTVEEVIAQMEAANSPDLANILRSLSEKYGWTRSVSISHPACEQTMPVTRVFSEVAQLDGTELARAFVDDTTLQQFYTALGITPSPATSVHGFYTVSPSTSPGCFASEIEYSLNFEYWGLLISVGLQVNAPTDPAMVYGLLDQLAAMVVARVDALAGSNLQPTPSAAVTVPLTPGQPTVQPLSALIPTESSAPVARPTATPVPTTRVTLADIESVMPTIQDIGLPRTFSLNEQLSVTQTRDETIAFWQQSLGAIPLTNSLAAALRQSNMIGQVVRVWDTGDACPGVVGLSVEVDVLLFQEPGGPTAFLSDQDYREAMQAVGVQLQDIQGGGWYSQLPFTGACGEMISYTRSKPYEQYIISASVTAYETSSPDDVIGAIDTLGDYMVQRLQQANFQ